MRLTIEYSSIQKKVCNHLSVIGKRAVDGKGNSLWSNITLQKGELEVINDYIMSGAHKIVSTLKDVLAVDVLSDNETSIEIDIDVVRWGGYKERYFEKMFPRMSERFCQSYALAEFLNMVQPELGRKYEVEELSILSDLKGLALMKDAPQVSDKGYEDISVSYEIK